MEYLSLEEEWEAQLADGSVYPMQVPGSLDESRIGGKDMGANQWHPDADLGNAENSFDPDAPIATRYTRKHTYEGEAKISRMISYIPEEEKRVFLEVERARCLKLEIDGKEISDYVEPSISTPHIFEVTDVLDGEHRITLRSDNSYPGLPHDAIVFSSAATDETQTNWNGLLGYVRLRTEREVFFSAVRVYPKENTIDVQLVIDGSIPYKGILRVTSPALEKTEEKEIEISAGVHTIALEGLKLKENVKKWDEEEGNLYDLTASLQDGDEKSVTFGVRDFGDDGHGHLALNGRRIFLRSEANCCEFPKTGHPPMTVGEWDKILRLYHSYGVNCMRFHSHIPPEAAFTAADQMGMLMQPELSHWNPKNAFEGDDSYEYYQRELKQTILWLANHPSFVMLTFGNELWTGELGHQRMDAMVELAHSLDTTRMYANGSNPHYGTIGCDAKSDFYTSQKYYEYDLRGTFAAMPGDDGIQGYINNQYPSAAVNYDDSMKHLRETYQKPVFSFEVGQFEILPDFGELEEFHGISDPANLRIIQEKAEKLGLIDNWNAYVEATGEISRIGYREEVEAVMRTEDMSGISLLGLQDFPGQGTALVGMINSHMQSKPYDFAKPERFASFFRAQLPLAALPKYTYVSGEILEAEVRIANYGKTDMTGPVGYCMEGGKVRKCGELPAVICPAGGITSAGKIEISLEDIDEAVRLDLTVEQDGVKNQYPVWIYPAAKPVCPDKVYETKTLDEKAVQILENGGSVYLAPDSEKEHLPSSIQAQFTSDFWSVGTFAAQEGGMGQLIDEKHPIFKNFPTEFHTNWQWWPMASQRAVIFPHLVKAIVTEMDSYAYMRPMAQLAEFRCGGGKLLFSSMGLQNLQQYPESRALLHAIYQYMDSEAFAPEEEISVEEMSELVK